MTKRLVPVAERNARKRLAEFIDQAQHECAAFGRDFDWMSAAWNITVHCAPATSKARRNSIIYFTTHENGAAKGIEGRTPMKEPFASFVKAVVRRKQDGRSVTLDPLERFSAELNRWGFTRRPFSDSRSVLAKEAGTDGPSFIA